MRQLPIQFLNECFRYEPTAGALVWLPRPRHHFASAAIMARANTKFAGTLAGSSDTKGYIRVKFRVVGKQIDYLAHRVIWAMSAQEWPENEIDHINGDRSDNRIENLREATSADNKRNTKVRRDNSSGYKGVSRYKHKFRARIRVDGRLINLGDFDTAEDAYGAYVLAAHKYHGAFVRSGP